MRKPHSCSQGPWRFQGETALFFLDMPSVQCVVWGSVEEWSLSIWPVCLSMANQVQVKDSFVSATQPTESTTLHISCSVWLMCHPCSTSHTLRVVWFLASCLYLFLLNGANDCRTQAYQVSCIFSTPHLFGRVIIRLYSTKETKNSLEALARELAHSEILWIRGEAVNGNAYGTQALVTSLNGKTWLWNYCNTVMSLIITFWSTMDHIYNGGPLRL